MKITPRRLQKFLLFGILLNLGIAGYDFMVENYFGMFLALGVAGFLFYRKRLLDSALEPTWKSYR